MVKFITNFLEEKIRSQYDDLVGMNDELLFSNDYIYTQKFDVLFIIKPLTKTYFQNTIEIQPFQIMVSCRQRLTENVIEMLSRIALRYNQYRFFQSALMYKMNFTSPTLVTSGIGDGLEKYDTITMSLDVELIFKDFSDVKLQIGENVIPPANIIAVNGKYVTNTMTLENSGVIKSTPTSKYYQLSATFIIDVNDTILQKFACKGMNNDVETNVYYGCYANKYFFNGNMIIKEVNLNVQRNDLVQLSILFQSV